MLELKRAADSNSFKRTLALVDKTNQLKTLTVGNGVATPPFSYTYDENGNLVLEATERHFEWDHSDRMKVFRNQVKASNGALAEPSVHAHYFYDSAGMRVKKFVRKQGGLIEIIDYVGESFDSQRALGSENNSVHVIDAGRRVATQRIGEPFSDDLTPTVMHHHNDQLGNVNVVMGNDASFINREEYTPYGETSLGSFARKRFRFAGKERDAENGLNYHRARHYAPGLARWISCDPVGFLRDGSSSLYVAVCANPLSFVDQDGCEPERPVKTQTPQSPSRARLAFVAFMRFLSEDEIPPAPDADQPLDVLRGEDDDLRSRDEDLEKERRSRSRQKKHNIENPEGPPNKGADDAPDRPASENG